MLRERYRITTTGKKIIFQILLFFIGTVWGLTWTRYINNKEWDRLMYNGVEVSGFHLDNRSVKEDETLIKSQYIDPLIKKNIIIVANNKSYTLDNSKLIKKYAIESTVIKSSNLDEKLTLHEKSMILKKGVSQIYNVKFNYDENYIKDRIRAIENDYNIEAVNASINSINHENIKINPSIKGHKIDEDKLEKEVKEKINNKNSSDMRIKAPIIESEASISTEKIFSINTKVSSFATNFSFSSYERSNNIELSTKLINGTLLMPGEIFSFNDRVGERTKNRGFMIAPIIVGDKVNSGIGGGICQVSSTLYNAVLRAGIKPLERAHHSLPSSYVKLGLDATVNWNNIDFKFKNTLRYPIYIELYTQDKKLYVNIYANSSLLSRKYVISSNVYKTEARVTRCTYENEKLIASEIISNDEYHTLGNN